MKAKKSRGLYFHGHISKGAEAQFSSQLSANALEEAADDGRSAWVPAIHMGDQSEVSRFCLCPAGPTLDAMTNCRVNQKMENISLSSFLCHPAFQLNKQLSTRK